MTRVEFPEPPPTGVAPTPEATDFAATDPSLAVASLSGIFSAGAGGRLLMDLFVNERSGRLVVAADPGPKGTLFVLHGEPVHAVPVDGDEALLKRLEARRALHPSARVNASTSMNLVSQIARNRWAKPVAVLEALRDEVREFARALFGAVQGLWRFFDDVEFADTTPLTAVNPFGLVLEARRKGLEPDALVRLGDVLGFKTPGPLAGFANVAPRLRSFTGHVDLGGVLDGTMRGAELFKLTGLDPIMGGLVLGALADTGIIELLNTPRATPSTERRQAPTSVLPALVQTDAQQLSQLALLPERGGVDILSLYVELKPERDDNALLGIDVDATPAAIERGFQSRMAELDPRAIAAGASRPYLLARAEELRTKVERSYRARTAGQARAAVDAYDILDRVGEGGMAEVFRGRASDDPNRVVAIKRILPKHRGDAEFARMFLEEARIAKRVQHPNVVRVFTVGKSGEDLYLAMEFVDGCDLGELLRRVHKLKQQVPVDVACKIIADACGGLHAAHRAHDRDGNLAPILHRDVSPQNILVSVAGDVKLTDFGIAKATERTQTGDDKRGVVKGKVAFLPPEVVDGQRASVRSDVYAMAMTMYATVAKLPFTRADALETMRAILYDALPRVSSMRDDAPPGLDPVLLRAGARNPEERHASAQELQLDLEELLAILPPVDVGAWVRSLGGAKHTIASPPPAVTQTVPIDVDLLDDL